MTCDKKNILVVGGAGFIGSHMALMLQETKFHPVILDNLSTGHRDAALNSELVIGNIADTVLIDHLFNQHQFTAVMHFASCIEVGESVVNPLKYYQNNVTATLALLKVMLQHQVKHFIFSSSAAVYGNPISSFITESHPLAPINPYGRSKLMVEEILKDLADAHEFNYAILRYFNAAGADPQGRLGERHQPESHLLPLVLQVAAGTRQAITVYGNNYATVDGTCIRDYVHVTDLCQAHLQALEALLAGEQKLICNLGTGLGYSVLQVIEAARKVTGHAIPVIHGLPRNGDPAILVADAATARQQLHWQPEYSDIHTMIKHAWQFANSLAPA
jgi:UDP-glucose 4-epimerase